MVSVAAKMSLFTTMALASTYNIGSQLNGQIAALEAAIEALET